MRSGIFTLAVLLLGLGSGPDPIEAATVDEWRTGIDAIERQIITLHPDPFTKTGELIFRREAAALREALPRLTEAERIVGLMRLVASIGDGHTGIELQDRSYARWYPIRLYEFTDGYYVTAAHNSVRDLAGARVLSVAGQPIQEVASAARSLMGADNTFDRMERLYAFHNAFLMQGLGFAEPDGSLRVTLQLDGGEMVERRLEPHAADDRYEPGVPIFSWIYPSEVFGLPFGEDSEWVAAFRRLPSSAFLEPDEERPLHLYHPRAFTRRALPELEAYYLQINYVTGASMVAFVAESLEEVARLRPRRLIVDLRYNFGGDGSTVVPMIHEFVRRTANPPWEELYLVTGRKTFSAGVMMVDAFLDHLEVTVIGEPAGAYLNHYGDATSRPHSDLGLDLSVSTLYHQLSDSSDLRSFIPVEVPAPMSFADYVAARDPAIDPILAGEEMRSIATIARQEGGVEARRTYLDRRDRFADLSWWSPPEEIALRAACDDLIGEERLEEALETCRLNTEIHPHVWNTWFNLAAAQKAAGQAEDRFASYQCVVALAPNNWNVPSILELFRTEGVDPSPPSGCPTGEV